MPALAGSDIRTHDGDKEKMVTRLKMHFMVTFTIIFIVVFSAGILLGNSIAQKQPRVQKRTTIIKPFRIRILDMRTESGSAGTRNIL